MSVHQCYHVIVTSSSICSIFNHCLCLRPVPLPCPSHIRVESIPATAQRVFLGVNQAVYWLQFTCGCVQVPVANLMGKENKGFEYIMYNFNHERWFIVAMVRWLIGRARDRPRQSEGE